MEEFRSLFKTKKVCVLVPTYNNEQTLEKVLTDILLFTDQVIVVNDGSTDSTKKILQKFPEIIHVDIDDIGKCVEVLIPHMF